MDSTKSTFAKFLDNFIYCISIIAFSIVWCGYVINIFWLQIFIGCLFGVLLYVLLFKIIGKFKNMTHLKKNEEIHKNECIKTLSIADPNKILKFFKVMLDPKYIVKIQKNNIIAISKTEHNTSFIIAFNFFVQLYTLDILYNTIKESSKYKMNLLIFAQSFSPDCINTSSKLEHICLLDANASYLFFKEFNTFPKIPEKIKEKRFSNIKNNIFSPINAKRFFKTSILVLLLSLITPLRNYYLVFASVMFIIAIICHLKKSKTPTPIDFRGFIYNKCQ